MVAQQQNSQTESRAACAMPGAFFAIPLDVTEPRRFLAAAPADLLIVLLLQAAARKPSEYP
jgi:hypothetical protein